jgi:hypothetical protein
MYLQGVSFEQSGQVVEAIRYYKRAMQLVPDIEKKVYSPKPKGIISVMLSAIFTVFLF